ncbi:MAG TPA: JAB domain-containing protein [Clostridia bacterium]|nr:JAB domain-containing protein [Clostridia bacterium]
MDLIKKLKNIDYDKFEYIDLIEIKRKTLDALRLKEPQPQGKITCPREATEFLKEMEAEEEEYLKVIYINARSQIIKKETLTKRTSNQTLISSGDITRKALLTKGTSGVIVAHNHPSGIADPSADDKISTEQLKKALKTLDLQLIDHIIICENEYFSFKESGML